MSFDSNNWFFQCSYFCTEADEALWRKWTSILPVRQAHEPYHSGPDFVQKARMALQITGAKSVLEIGFNLGHSAAVWLNLGVDLLHSHEIRHDAPVLAARNTLETRFPFSFQLNGILSPRGYDLIFIDGAHDFGWVCTDIETGKVLGVPYFLLDDFDEHHGPGVAKAIEHHRLVPIAHFPNTVLCVPEGDRRKRL